MNPLFMLGAIIGGGAIALFAYWAGINIAFRRLNPVDRAEVIRRIAMKTDRGNFKTQGVGVIRAFMNYRGGGNVLAFAWLIAFSVSYAAGVALGWGLSGSAFGAFPISLLALTMVVRRSARKQRINFERQLMAAMPLIAGQLEAGSGKRRALERVVEVIEDPLRSEFAGVLNQMEAGVTVTDAFRELAKHYPISSMKLFIAALEADESSTGGNLAPILRAIAEGLERRFELRAEAQAEIAQTRYQFYGIVGGLCAISFLMYNMGGPETKASFTSLLGILVLIPVLLNALWGIIRVQKLFNQAEGGF